MAIIVEIIKILGWSFIAGQSILFRRYFKTDIFWITMIASMLMIIASFEGLLIASCPDVQALCWLIADLFIIFVFIYRNIKNIRSGKQLEDFKIKAYNDLIHLKSNEKTRNNK